MKCIFPCLSECILFCPALSTLPLHPCPGNTPKLSRFVWGTWRFDSIRKKSIRTTGSQDPWNNDAWTFLVLKTWQQTWVDSSEVLDDSTRFARSRYSAPEVKIREIIMQNIVDVNCWRSTRFVRFVTNRLLQTGVFSPEVNSWQAVTGLLIFLRFDSNRTICCEWSPA